MTWAFLVDSVPFSKAVVDGETSLGGSESACLGLARALQRRGHQVHVFVARLAEDAAGLDAAGVTFHPIGSFAWMNQFIEWDVVCALRQSYMFAQPVHARMRLLWNQDLLTPDAGKGVMAIAYALDHLVYVSAYHRRQWEAVQPELASIGWVTKNGYDPGHVPAESTKDPNRIIHISRPERGLGPLLAMWPDLRQARPSAELRLCRYASMYDGEGSAVAASCASFDEAVARVHAEVGGITWLGTLNKAQLYREIAEAAVMWYPGIETFAETSCIAAIEAQACGTPFVGSWRGALPETVPNGLFTTGKATDPDYQQASITDVLEMLDGCRTQSFAYRRLQRAGREHVKAYTYDVLAQEWETQIEAWFTDRYERNQLGILRQLLHEDDHVAAKVVAHDLEGCEEATQAIAFCDRVIAGLEQGAEDYASHAIQDPLREVELSGRFQAVVPHFKDCRRVLDIACGNGAGAIALALAYPTLQVHGLDYAAHNIELATDAARRAGVGDRCTFAAMPVWDFETGAPATAADEYLTTLGINTGWFDGAFIGEFVEHIADCTRLVDWVESFLTDGAVVVYTCPVGPFGELVPRGQPIQRGHVHSFKHDDIKVVWGQKRDSRADFFAIGLTPRGAPIGHWIIHYRTAPDRPAGRRDLAARVRRTRPLQRLSVGLIVKNAGLDLARCLTSVWDIADEMVVGDTGSTDDTVAIAESYGARVLRLDPVEDQPEGFAGARNAVLRACTGDWFLWIDADEQLIANGWIRRYLDGALYQGFVLRQVHLYLDGAPAWDVPVRLFRHTGRVQFYGCIHEQPQDGDANALIEPTLQLDDVQLAHTGYLTEAIRDAKRVQRNVPLLKRDQVVFKDRLLGQVLALREAVIQADHLVARGGLTPHAQQGYAIAIRLFVEHFDDPAHRYHAIARPWYEAALRHLGLGWEMEIALAGRAGGLGGSQAAPARVWVRDHAEFERLLAHRVATFKAGMTRPAFHTAPILEAPVREAVSA